jgi:hypothetical protein
MNLNIRCVTYSPAFSAGGCSLNDLLIGVKHGVVGCGSKVFNASNLGDYVIINAEKNKVKYVVIGILCEKLESCDKWEIEGGCAWPYNWTYKPITTIFIYDDLTKLEVKKIAEDNLLNPKIVFNSRFCSVKLRPIIEMLIKKFSL